ncbi:hypothetical protein GCM10011348_01920 [Marinobacterium nitratireducens]|uniref:Uncharacterized protein n=1 Tax=Marinobacterium nitratireducens TaxID=518897 RepID=A0A917Z8M3_9GAMM|nr:hypothetical protein [Marinobacterium nitratireducens]GGO75930.1 hypothetical protein GCM10011348_01920 [Marinobacterium nitratireducens]
MKQLSLATALALGTLSTIPAFAGDYDKPGFVTEVEDGRLWVFRENSAELRAFQESGAPARQYTDIGSGPNGMTVKAADEQTLRDYLSSLGS